MCNKDDCLMIGSARQKTVLKQVAADLWVNSRKRVVKKVNVPVTVHCTGQANPLLLAPAQIYSALTDLQKTKC